MFTFLIISGDQNIAADVHQVFSTLGVPKQEPGGRFVVESASGMKDGWIAFQPIIDIQHDYDANELVEIGKKIKNPSFFLIEGRNGTVNFSNKFILGFNPVGKVMIDNDHGIIAELLDIKEKIRSGEDWLHLSP